MEIAKLLEQYGVHYEDGLARCMGDADFYRRMLSMAVKDTSFARAKQAYASGDQAAMFACMHELKGASGNMGMTELHEPVARLTELLRNGSAPEAEVAPLFAQVEAAYDRAMEGARLALGEPER